MSVMDFVGVACAAFAAGMVNALAGGGTLITFPVLTAIGLPAVMANVTNAVALCPGYFGGAWAQRRDLAGQSRRLWILLPLGAVGGMLGAWLLLISGERLFRALVPWLILLASALLAAQGPLRQWLIARGGQISNSPGTAAIPIGIAAVYGGYFGAGLGVVMLATLGVTLEDTLNRLNAVKQVLSCVINLSAALFFLNSHQIHWPVAAVMAVGALVGGSLGGRWARVIAPTRLRYLVVIIGVGVGIFYLLK
jgi:uncharacterized membrane protein YfcA